MKFWDRLFGGAKSKSSTAVASTARLRIPTPASTVRDILSHELKPAPDETFETLPIHDAASAGDLEAVKKQIESNPEIINLRNNNGTPLHLAACYGHKDVVIYLLSQGADVNAKGTVMGYTPLRFALEWHKDEIAEVLRQHGGR
jgi:ankyrin repeat protein